MITDKCQYSSVIINQPVSGDTPSRRGRLARPTLCTKTAQKSANSGWLEQTACERRGDARRMGKVITVQFRRSILPRRLLDDGWWLEARPARPIVLALPKPRPPDPKRGFEHLTLIKSEK
jgi:hypothetical protein